MKFYRDIKQIIRVTAVLVILFTAGFQALSQSKPKPKSQEDPAPTQKEIEEMMREAQQEMNNMSEEDKKMMEQMGIKMPSLNEMPNFTDQQMAEAYANDVRSVPKKDAARIAVISKTPLTSTTMPAFLSATHAKVSKALTPGATTKGEEIYKTLKTQHNSPVATGNAAAGLWMLGRTELALYVMGKACLDDPANSDNTNNYAAMLSMSGAEQLAIPLLENLNKRFRKNSTILNNLGQAWFGLGEISKANAYLDSTIRIYANHSQANYTKSVIEESKGNTKGAVEALKRSIKKAYSPEKESDLNGMGYKLKSDDLNWDHPMPQDALGLEKFKWPAYPNNVMESDVLKKEWDQFKKACQKELEKLNAQQQKLEQEMIEATQARMSKLLQAGQSGQRVDPMPPMASKAIIKLKYLVDGKDGQLVHAYQTKGEALANAYIHTGKLEETLFQQLSALQKKYEDQFGEGKPNPFDAACRDENAAKDAFLSAANTELNQRSTDFLNFMRKKINDETYYNQYTMWPEVFELTKLNAKIQWLSLIRDQKVMFQEMSGWCQATSEQKEKPFKLSEFDDVHCQYHSKLTTPVGTIRTDCSRMTSELDLKFIKLGLKQDMNQETFGDQFMSCTVEVGVGTGAGVNLGPLKAEASVGAGVGVEIDRSGIRDVIIKASGSVSAGTDIIKNGSSAGVGVSDLSIDVGVKGQVSIVSGMSSGKLTGLLGK